VTRRRRSPRRSREKESAPDAAPTVPAAPGAPSRKMLMNVLDPEEVRVAIVGQNGLEELYLERAGTGFVHGNIYKGRIQNVEPSLQAAFVDIGGDKNGFLHVSDVIPPAAQRDPVLTPAGGRKRRRPAEDEDEGPKPPIETMLQKGQEILVQITRESLGHKGPSLTTYVSLPGRYLVLMPAIRKRGVSRKIGNDQERKELMAALAALEPPDDLGLIIRTAGMGRGKDELKNDLDYLVRLWEAIRARTQQVQAPAAIYQESDLVIRAIRDYFYDDIAEIWIDGQAEWSRACDFLRVVMPGFAERCRHWAGPGPLFHRYGVEEAIAQIYSRSVRLPGGGEIVIDQTEALVAIDVNSGRLKKDSSRDTILSTNLEAAAEIARQLRLRDLGGLIMIDFIDMDEGGDRRKVEEAFREAMRRDRARSTALPISALGVLELSRQRVRQSVKQSVSIRCPACGGSGIRRSLGMLGLDFLRRTRAALEGGSEVVARLHPDAALPLANARRAELSRLETETGGHVVIVADPTVGPDEMKFDRREKETSPEG